MSAFDFPMTYADLEARPAWKHAFLEHCLVHQGEQHPETLIAKNDYALSLYDAGEFGRACDMLDDVVAQMRKVFGKRSRTTMVSTGNFALALMAVDDAQKAYAMQSKVFKWHRRHSGELHPDTLLAMAYLANICFHMGESPRVLRRLQPLRRWSHEEVPEVFPRSARARGAHGAGAPSRLPLAVGGH